MDSTDQRRSNFSGNALLQRPSEKLSIQPLPSRSVDCYLELYRGSVYAGDRGVVVPGQVQTGGAEAASQCREYPSRVLRLPAERDAR